MSVAVVLGDAALAAGVLVELGCCLGLLRMRNALDRLHFSAPATTVGPVLIAAAVLLDGAGLQDEVKVAGIALLLAVVGPVLTHMLARAIWAREAKTMNRGPGDVGPREPEPGELLPEPKAD